MCCHIPAAPRLACVRPVASVHPEPGSNSSLLFILSFVFFCFTAAPPNGGYARQANPWSDPGRLLRLYFFKPVRKLDSGAFLFALLYCFSLLFLYCNRFNVLSLTANRGSFQNSLAKLRQVFVFTKLFRKNFCSRFLAAPLNVRSRKASAKLQPISGFSKCREGEISFTKTRYRPKNMFYNILFHSAK